MNAARRRLHPPALDRSELVTALAASAVTLVLVLAASRRLGLAGLLAPLVLALAVLAMRRPLAMVTLLAGLVILCEGQTFGILTFTADLYKKIYHDLTFVDVLVALTVISIAVDLVRRRRGVYVPGPLQLPLILLALAMAVGFVVGHAAGVSIRFDLASENVLAYLLFLPVAVANLDMGRRGVQRLLVGGFALAVVKSLLGLAELASGHGRFVEKGVTITYYEPLSNWLVMMALLALLALAVAKVRLPVWVYATAPLLAASLLLSYRRSFWVAFALALVLLVMLAVSPIGRRLLVPAAICIGLAVWLVGSVHFQSQLPIVKRAVSLSPTRIEANAEDRYRLDERANVIAEIGRHPIEGIGVTTPWNANTRPLPVEHEGGRQYVHFAALWYWLKLGIVGLLAYVGMLLASAVLAFRVWRSSQEPYIRAFGLASLCAIVGLAVIETTATFTGVDGRFTVLFAVQLGLLALLARPYGLLASSD